MIEAIRDLPDGVIGFEAVGDVVPDDYRDTLVPALDAAAKAGDKIRLLFLAGERMGKFTPGAMWEDSKLAFHHVHWYRSAFVTDISWMDNLSGAFGWLVPGKFKVFPTAELDAAKAWVAADD